MNKTLSIIFIHLYCYGSCFGQDLSQIGKAKLFSYSGGISANSVFYEGSAVRDPFTYVLSGNLNFNISGLYNIPLSFTYSNQEFEYSRPFKFNRLSIHPSYKWITAHIGDVSMNFSPYTLSGHQFTGLGFDLTPKGAFKISAMYGRLIRPVEYDATIPDNTPAYRRYGYGLKTSYDFKKANIGVTFFKAKDDINSLEAIIPSEVGIDPKDNLVVSLEGSIKVLDNTSINFEYATSAVTENTNSDSYEGSLGSLSLIFNEKLTTSYYDALNLNLTYALGSGSLGVGYERIDPDYRTLGAYFFSNDLENITVNASQTIFKGKLGITANAGLQRDNLDNTKKGDLTKFVSAINLNLNASERMNIAASYSNFQSFNNIRSQFDFINEVTDFDNIDNLNFKQLSQNANLNAGYVISKTKKKKQNLNISLTYQNVEDSQEQAFTGIENNVNTTQLFNGSTAYTISYPERSLNFSGVFNATINETQQASSVAYGPTLVIGKQFLDKKLRTTFSGSYNTSSTEGIKQNDIFNFRFNAGYVVQKKHNFNMSLLSLFRDNPTTTKSNDFTATLNYSYSFSSGERKKNNEDGKPNTDGLTEVKLRYREIIYQGNALGVLSQIESLRRDDFPAFKKESLDIIKNDISLLKSEEKKILKEQIINYLEAIYHFLDFNEQYDTTVFNAVMALKKEAKEIDNKLEAMFVETRIKIENHTYKGVDPKSIKDKTSSYEDYVALYARFIEQRQKFVGHRWMQKQLHDIQNRKDYNKKREIRAFKAAYLSESYKTYSDSENDLSKVESYLLIKLIDYYQELAIKKVDPANYILKYISKSN